MADVINRPWLAHYDAGVPPSLAYPPGTLVDYFARPRRERPAHPALLFKGTTLTYGELDRLSAAFAASLAADGVRQGRPRRASCCPTARSSSSRSSAPGRPARSSWRSTRSTPSASSNCRSANGRRVARHADAVLRAGEGGAAAHRRAPRHRDQHQGIPAAAALRCCSRCSARRRKAIASRSRRATRGSRALLAAGAGKPAPDVTLSAGRSRRHPDERRHDRHAEGRRRRAPRLRAGRPAAAPRGSRRSARRGTIASCCRCRCSTSTPTSACRAWRSSAATRSRSCRTRATSTTCWRRSAGAAGVLHRRADAVHRAAQPSRRAGGPCRLQLDPSLLLGRGGADGRNAARFEELTGGRIVEGYSLTEGHDGVLVNPVRGTEKIGSVGMPLPDVDVRIVDADDRHACSRPRRGRRAPHPRAAADGRATGTTRRETALALQSTAGGRHVAAHRRSRLPRRGRLRVHRRSQEGPDQDERLPGVAARDRRGARRAPGGAEVGVAGVPDAAKGEVVKAWVVLKPGTAGDRRGAARVLPGAAGAVQGARRASSSGPSCRRPWSARCCAAC